MQASLNTFDLPEGFRPSPGDPLQEFLIINRAQPVAVNIAILRRLDVMIIQSLLVAAAEWRRRGLSFAITDARSDLEQALRQIGVTDDLLARRVSS